MSDSFHDLLDGAGIPHTDTRFWCPAEECAHKPPEELNGSLFQARDGELKWKCHACGKVGDFADLYSLIHDTSRSDAWLHLIRTGLPPPKSDAVEVARDYGAVWEKLARRDPEGEAYLRGRGLETVVCKGWVRFSTRLGPFRCGTPLWGLRGAMGGIQFRSVDPSSPRRFYTLKGSTGYLGNTMAMGFTSHVWVAEGWADTLTLLQAHGPSGLGVTGKDNLTRLAKELEDLGIRGRVITCKAQRDKDDTSQRAFEAFAEKLQALGNTVRIELPPLGFKDWNDYCNR